MNNSKLNNRIFTEIQTDFQRSFDNEKNFDISDQSQATIESMKLSLDKIDEPLEVSNALVYFNQNPYLIDDIIMQKILKLGDLDVEFADGVSRFLLTISTSTKVISQITASIASIIMFLLSTISKDSDDLQDIASTCFEALAGFVVRITSPLSMYINESFFEYCFSSLDLRIAQLKNNRANISSLYHIRSVFRFLCAFCVHHSNEIQENARTRFIQLLCQLYPLGDLMIPTGSTEISLRVFTFDIIFWFSLALTASDIRKILLPEFYESLDQLLQGNQDEFDSAIYAIAAITMHGDEFSISFSALGIELFCSTFSEWDPDSATIRGVCLLFRHFAASLSPEPLNQLMNPIIPAFLEYVFLHCPYSVKKEAFYIMCYMIYSSQIDVIEFVLQNLMHLFSQQLEIFISDPDQRTMALGLQSLIIMIHYLQSSHPEQLSSFLEVMKSDEIVQTLHSFNESTITNSVLSLSNELIQILDQE